MSLVRVRAALGQERPPDLMLWVERAHLVPLVGLTLSGGCSEGQERVGSSLGSSVGVKGCARSRLLPSQLVLWDPHPQTWQDQMGQEDPAEHSQ